MAALLGGLGLSGATQTLSSVASVAFKELKDIAKFFVDPFKGPVVAFMIYQGVNYVIPYVQGAADSAEQQLDVVANSLLNANYEWIVPPPPNWGQAMQWASSLLPDVQCGFGDIVCSIQNGFRFIARNILAGLYTFGDAIYFAFANIAQWILTGLSRLAGFILKYAIKPLAKFVLNILATVLTWIRDGICWYLKVAPWASIIYSLVDGVRSGDIMKGVTKSLAGMVEGVLIGQYTGCSPVQFGGGAPTTSVTTTIAGNINSYYVFDRIGLIDMPVLPRRTYVVVPDSVNIIDGMLF